MFAYRTKLVAGFVALFLFSLIGHIVDRSYINRLYQSSSEVEDALLKLDYLSRFQLALERLLIPPNDYLIHGAPIEKTTHMNLIKQLDFMFKIGAEMDLTDEEQVLLKDAQAKFDNIKHLSGGILAIENPIGNKAGWEIMERLYASASLVQENLERIGIFRYEKTIHAISNTKSLYNLENKIYWISISLLAAFATVIGLSINRAANEREKAGQKVRNEAIINKAMLTVAKFTNSTTDEDAIIQEVARITPTLIKCDRCMIFLWDDKLKAFLPKACYGLEGRLVPIFKALRIKPGNFWVFDEVQNQKTSIVIEEPINSPLMPSEHVKTFNIMSNVHTPIINHGGVIGIFGIDYSREHHIFSPRDIATVEGIAAQAGIALENARLYRESMDRMMELEHRIETIQVMHDIDKSILSTINRDEILETAARMVQRVIPTDRVTITLVDKEAKCFRYVAGFGINYPKGFTTSFKDTNAADVLRTGRPISRSNVPLEKNLLPLDRQLMEQGFRSDVRVPIKVKGEIVAILNIGSYRIAAFTSVHLSTAERLADQLGVALENAKLFSDLQELLINTVKTLTSTIDAKSPWTRGHSERVTELAITVGKEMGLTQKDVDDLRLAGLLHDIGKIGTAEHIIDKPGRLTDEEFAIIKEHPLKGAEILKLIKQFADIIPGVAHHHEKVDGTGYPCKLKNGDIHLLGKILALADTYDAMVSDRPYRKAPGREKAIDEIKRCAGTQFDPVVVDAFLKAVEKGHLPKQ